LGLYHILMQVKQRLKNYPFGGAIQEVGAGKKQ
jgi:hypothetical protein